MTENQPVRHQFNVELPPDQEEGHYADIVGIWHNVDTMVFDFAVMSKPPMASEAADGQQEVEIRARVVARLRVPIRQSWEVMRSMEANLSAWEQETGQHPYGHQSPDL